MNILILREIDRFHHISACGSVIVLNISQLYMITMYEQSGKANKAVRLFRQMFKEEVSFDRATLLIVLSACSSLGSLEIGKWVHDRF
jgi:pentatricopeptide repeat protein